MVQPPGVLAALIDGARVSAFAFEDRAGVVQAVSQHMDLGVDVGHELAVKPDDTGHLVEGHCHGSPPVWASRPFALTLHLFCVWPQVPIWFDRPNRASLRARTTIKDHPTPSY